MDDQHPSVDILGSLGNSLEGKTIVLGISGSVGAAKSVELSRLLMRHGAEVHCVMTREAERLVGRDLLHWATGNRVITEITGSIEHVALVGNVPNPADLMIIAPATANTIGKMAGGIDDTPLTTFFTTAFGEGIPVILVPAMHQSMYNHPFVVENLNKLENHGVRVMNPRTEEGKAKIASPEDILEEVKEVLVPNGFWKDKHVVITAGRTVSHIDPIRVLTNNSSGKMGSGLAKAALSLGARVTIIRGKIATSLPNGASVIAAEEPLEMFETVNRVLREDSADILISAAAVNDWMVKNPSSEKISTHDQKEVQLSLVPTPKIIDSVKENFPNTLLVAFRALYNLEDKELLENAKARMKKAKADFIAVNDVSETGSGFETDTNRLQLISKSGEVSSLEQMSKEKAAKALLALIEKNIYNS
jgi:phosphopantothenoylcysteine decarboxylase/phosphopantothenate--cysteine ligase